ncbi:MAG TPA: FG-GAP-like repeat-containing protein, partial [Pyrinomonadaceae bacterium]
FSRPSNFPTAFFPFAGPVVADFNRDGKPDVATLDASHTGPGGAPRLAVLPADGAGGLGPPVFTGVNDNGPVELAGGDFDGDGNPDLLTLNRGGGFNNGGSAFVSLGDGTGHFTPRPRVSVDVATNPRAAGVADFNGDGKLDAAVPGGFGFSVMRGDGAGGFTQSVHYISANAGSVAVSDFNGDGKFDLALVTDSEPNGKVSVVLGDGAGGFGLAKSFAVGFFPGDVTAADFNGDGKPDLAVANAFQFNGTSYSPASVSVLLGDGAGNFGPAATVAADRSPRRIIAGDFNADGLTDLVTANQGVNNVSLLLNTCGASADAPPAFQFGASLYRVGEGAGSLTVTVTRTGGTAGPASVRYATSDGTASSRSDYIAALGTLRFADGESAKTFSVLVVDDARAGEGDESFRLTLSDPVGAALGGTTSAAVSIKENDPSFTNVNPIDSTAFFVRQHYLDFFSRQPDASGLQFWTNEIESCGTNQQCREVKRINVSAAFFLSIEFQETGYLVYRMYKAAYGDATSPNVAGSVPVVRLNEFLEDTQEIGRDVVVGQGNWEQLLEANKQAYSLEFVRRPRFLDAYPLTMTAAQFVAQINGNAGSPLTQAEADQVASALAAQGSGSAPARSAALRAVAESATLRQRETSRAFVLMQYFGYLRRNPDDAPEPGRNFAGWRFWLDKLEEFKGDFIAAEMVKAFITSDEYRRRFGQ